MIFFSFSWLPFLSQEKFFNDVEWMMIDSSAENRDATFLFLIRENELRNYHHKCQNFCS